MKGFAWERRNTKKMKNKISILNLLISLFLTSFILGCVSLKHNNEDRLIKKMIKNYAKTEFFNDHDVYEINKFNHYNDIELYSFMSKKSSYTPLLCDTIGGSSYKLPSNFKKFKGKLFLWYGNDSILTKKTLNVLKENVKLDSILYYEELGRELSYEEYPTIIQDDSKASLGYFVCKKNKVVLGSQFSSFRPKKKDVERLDCTVKEDNFNEIFPRYMNLLNPPKE